MSVPHCERLMDGRMRGWRQADPRKQPLGHGLDRAVRAREAVFLTRTHCSLLV